MGYQVIKKIDFNETYTQPFRVLKGAILKKDNGEQFIQLKLCNTGNDILSKASVRILCYDQDQVDLGVQSYTYDKIFIRSGETFGTDVPIPLQFIGTDTFSVELNNDYEKLQVSTNKIKKPKIDIPIILCNIIFSLLILIGFMLSLFLLAGGLGIIGVLILFIALIIKGDTIFIWCQIFYTKLLAFFRHI